MIANFQKIGEYEKAIDTAQMITDDDSKFEALVGISKVLSEKGEAEKLRELLQQYQQQPPAPAPVVEEDPWNVFGETPAAAAPPSAIASSIKKLILYPQLL